MKHSITTKYTFMLSALILFTVFANWFMNKTFLEDYYMYTKNQVLETSYHQVMGVLVHLEDNALTNEQLNVLDRLSSSQGLTIYILEGRYMGTNLALLYPYQVSSFTEGQEVSNMISEILSYKFDRGKGKEVLSRGDNYMISLVTDTRLDLQYVDLYSETNNYTILLRSNYDNLQDNVDISSKFLAIIGVFTTLPGTLIMFIMSKRMTRPILQLNSIARKMSGLDFDVKYLGTSSDEIGELGNSINQLSTKLEHTISELKLANNELQKDIEKKTQIDEMRKDFLSNVTHELKTPIALIQGYAEGLQDNINDDAESKDFYCEVIIDEANKMNTMVKKLLSLNQLEFGNNFVSFERFDIVSVIRSVLSSTEILMKQKEIQLVFDVNGPVYVWADEYLVEEVLTNYVSNALNHVDGMRIIEIKLIEKDDVVRIAVFNTGHNIPEEDLDKVWIKFFKVDKARTREYGGSGIGLSIVKAIMNQLNRECGVVNHETGVEFWFELDRKTEE